MLLNSDPRQPNEASSEYCIRLRLLAIRGSCATLSSGGHVGSELNRRTGITRSGFGVLRKLWNHSALILEGKVNPYQAMVENKLLHAVASLCLAEAQVRKLDVFQAMCPG